MIDASVVVAGLHGNPAAREILERGHLHAPCVLDAEVANALRRDERLGGMPPSHAAAAIGLLAVLGIRRHPLPPLLRRIWELRHSLSPYDASYVALATALGVELLTTDRRLAAAPPARGIVRLIEA